MLEGGHDVRATAGETVGRLDCGRVSSAGQEILRAG